jgi:uncharacterized membrane protein YhaH (DUF805 family)
MFKTPFNFDKRIRRTEYGLSLIAFFVCLQIIESVTGSNSSLEILNLLLIPAFWFIAAQGVKRCHDVGKPGWYQIIPFYIFVLLFSNSNRGENEYGFNPKEKVSEAL